MSTLRQLTYLAMCCVAVTTEACTSAGVRKSAGAAAEVQCKGDAFVDVMNPGGSTVDVYAKLSGEIVSPDAGLYVGAAPPGTTRLYLVGTKAARSHTGAFSGRFHGEYVREVTFRRGCDERRG